MMIIKSSYYTYYTKGSAYVKSYDGSLIENDYLLKKYNTIWDKVSSDLKKEFGSKPVYKKIFLNTIIKCYSDEATDFHDDKEIPNTGSNHTSLAIITIDSILKKMKTERTQIH